MAPIKAPRIKFDHPDRFLSCQKVFDAAVRAGWTEQEATASLVEVADNRMLNLMANVSNDRKMSDWH